MNPTEVIPPIRNIYYAGQIYDFHYLGVQQLGRYRLNLYRTPDGRYTLSESKLEQLAKEQQNPRR